MADNINNLLEIEAMADLMIRNGKKLKENCRKARARETAGVSTSATKKGLTPQQSVELTLKLQRKFLKQCEK